MHGLIDMYAITYFNKINFSANNFSIFVYNIIVKITSIVYTKII
jgi:hypothetical protein